MTDTPIEFRGKWIPDGFQVKIIRRPRKDVPDSLNSEQKLKVHLFAKPIRRYRIAYLYWLCGWNAQEVADELGVSKKTVKRAIEFLTKSSKGPSNGALETPYERHVDASLQDDTGEGMG